MVTNYEKIRRMPFESLTSIDERVDFLHQQLNLAQSSLNVLLESAGLPSPDRISALLEEGVDLLKYTFEPFKLAEFLGYSRGWTPQVLPRLDAGETFEITLTPPDDQIWWLTLIGAGEVLASSILLKIITSARTKSGMYGTQEEDILIDEAWLNQPMCPPGWRRIDNFYTFRATNVTGDVTYNDLAPQTVFLHCTCFILRISKIFVDSVENKLGLVL